MRVIACLFTERDCDGQDLAYTHVANGCPTSSRSFSPRDKIYIGANADDRGSTWEITDGGRLLVLHLDKWTRQYVPLSLSLSRLAATLKQPLTIVKQPHTMLIRVEMAPLTFSLGNAFLFFTSSQKCWHMPRRVVHVVARSDSRVSRICDEVSSKCVEPNPYFYNLSAIY